MLTDSQRQVFEALTLYGETFFAREFRALKIKPRLFPLIVGPTGAGKSFLVRKAAAELDSHYLRLTFGDWLPRGVRPDSGGQTAFTIISAALEEGRVLLHIDELDKMREDFEHHWTRAVANDVWNVLDGNLPVRDYFKVQRQDATPEQVADAEAQLRKKLWIVGSGTWQSVFEQESRSPMGFGSASVAEFKAEAASEKIRSAKTIPEELLARFSSNLLFVRYPASDVEKQSLLEECGLLALAKQLGRHVGPTDLDFNRGGMRRLETLAADLLLDVRRTAALSRKPRGDKRKCRAPAARGDPGDLFSLQDPEA